VKEEEKSVYEEVEDHDDLFFVQNYDTQADLPHNFKVGIFLDNKFLRVFIYAQQQLVCLIFTGISSPIFENS